MLSLTGGELHADANVSTALDTGDACQKQLRRGLPVTWVSVRRNPQPNATGPPREIARGKVIEWRLPTSDG